jgi:phage recombination protein Bet
MAQRYRLEPEEFKRVIKATCGLQKATDEEFLAFLMIAHQHDLNPLTKEIYAFVKPTGGGIQPIVGVDGWYKKANEHPAFNGLQFKDEVQGGQLVSVTAIIYRKDRTHPIEITEYMKECRRDTQPWKQMPARMLRHKAAIQAIRVAFNLAGIMEPDEAERYMEMLKDHEQAIEQRPHDDLPVPTAGRVKPTSDQAVESAAAASPPLEEQEVVAPPPPPPDEFISEDEADRLIKVGDAVGMSASKVRKYVQQKYGVGDLNELRKSQATDLSTDLRKRASK